MPACGAAEPAAAGAGAALAACAGKAPCRVLVRLSSGAAVPAGLTAVGAGKSLAVVGDVGHRDPSSQLRAWGGRFELKGGGRLLLAWTLIAKQTTRARRVAHPALSATPCAHSGARGSPLAQITANNAHSAPTPAHRGTAERPTYTATQRRASPDAFSAATARWCAPRRAHSHPARPCRARCARGRPPTAPLHTVAGHVRRRGLPALPLHGELHWLHPQQQ